MVISMYYVFNKILFDYVKVYNQILLKSEMEQALMLLTSDIPSYFLPGLNMKIPEKPLRKELKQILKYILQNDDTMFHRNEVEFQWAQRDFLTYMMEATYWQKMELVGSMSVIFAKLLCPFHRKIIYAALMALDEILQFYKTDAAAQQCTMPEQDIFILPPLPSLTDEH